MTILDKTVREIAVESPASVRVFEDFNIDYCCGGAKSLSEACAAVSVEPEVVREKLNAVLEASADSGSNDAPEQKSATELIGYILEKHHTFTTRELERLTPLMDKVTDKHGERHPELRGMREKYQLLREDLIPHMMKEETVLFPFIEQMTNAQGPTPAPPFGSVKNPIRMMMFEHEAAGATLKEMRALSGGFKTPEDACPSYNALYFGLEELERDLHRHIHLENNVLFPMAISMEEDLL
ncbi:MAG: iron-sulfur cluster repair di-iron protein [Acidobacteriota bacterium]|nr:iron-sulfur cluster repair di-iron protein [Acidobacteriota bacterium]